MKNRQTQHPDLETLSAYLDHELSEAEDQALRTQLTQDAALQRQLSDLRQTRYVLRQTPKVKRPRSFVLTPEMVKRQRAAFGAWNISRWVSAVASVLLIAVIGGQYLLSGASGMLASAPQNDLTVMADEALEEPAAEEPMMAMEAPEEGLADDSAMTDIMEDEPAEAPSVEMLPMPTPTLEGTLDPGGGGGLPPVDVLPTPTAEILGFGGGPTMTPEAEEYRFVPSEKVPGLGDDDGQSAAAAGEMAAEDEQIPPQSGLEISPWRLAQAGLLALALTAGVLAAYFRKQVR